jgi:hypothetical protein
VADVGDAAVVGNGDLAVEHDLAPAGQQIAERRAKRWGPVVPVPGDQPQPAAPVEYGDDPVAVVLDFVQPVVAFRRPCE